MLEETYEVLDAIDRGDHDALRGEIGDLLFEGVFLAQIEPTKGASPSRLAARVTAKLVRRHPHVFGSADGRRRRRPGARAVGADQVARAGNAGQRRSVLARHAEGAAGALLGAHEIGTRVAAVGFDWARRPTWSTRSRRRSPSCAARRRRRARRVEEEMGDLLFAIANLARKLGIEPESALRKANQKFTERFQKLETRSSQGRSVHDATLEEMEEAVWQQTQ